MNQKKIKNKKNINNEDKLRKILELFPTQRKRGIEKCISSITKNSLSSWLSTIPLKRDHFDLSPSECRGALAVSYHIQPAYMPKRCDGIGINDLNLEHAPALNSCWWAYNS